MSPRFSTDPQVRRLREETRELVTAVEITLGELVAHERELRVYLDEPIHR